MPSVPKRLDPKLTLVVLSSLVLFVLLQRHTPWLNGPAFWKWPWQKLDATRTYPALLAAAVPFAAALWLRARTTSPVAVPLLLLMLAQLLLMALAAGLQSVPFSLQRIPWIVEHPVITSYYTDAQAVGAIGPWLDSYPEGMREHHLHARNKPPGLLLYYVLAIRLFGEAAPTVGGWLVGTLGTLSIPATYVFIRTLGGSERGAFLGASYMTLCPGPVMFFPEFDQVYPVPVCATLICWMLALRSGRLAWAAGFGVGLFALTFTSYGLLVIGAFLGMVTLNHLGPDPPRRLPRVLVLAAAGLGVTIAGYALLRWTVGFDSFDTFATAVLHQEIQNANRELQRPYPQTIFFDLTDFALGTGWISYLLVGYFLARRRAEPTQDASLRTAIFCVAQILFVAGAGLIQTETARVWIFLAPLLMFPIGEELARWSTRSTATVFACLWCLLAAVHKNMMFIHD